MGEYANYKGQNIKIGTCEDLYYLRADQRELVEGYEFDEQTLNVFRFRFPFPDEDGLEPGAFEDYDRGVKIPGWSIPDEIAGELDHGIVQFTAPQGYNLCVPCPEGPDTIEGLTIHRNGWNGGPRVVQQGFREGELRLIVKCGSCGYCWNMPREIALEIALAFKTEAAREEYRPAWDEEQGGYAGPCRFEPANTEKHRSFLLEMADRIEAGYTLEAAAV